METDSDSEYVSSSNNDSDSVDDRHNFMKSVPLRETEISHHENIKSAVLNDIPEPEVVEEPDGALTTAIDVPQANSLETAIHTEEPADGLPGAALTEESTHRDVTKKRKRVSDCRDWKRAESKAKRMKGESYVGFRRANPKCTKKIVHDVPREAREIGPACVSPLCAKWQKRMCNNITEEERQDLFGKFWKEMTWEAKKMFVCGSVNVMKCKRSRVGEDSRRNLSYFYFLQINGEKVPVCQQMYLNTLGITKDEVRYWLENFHVSNIHSANFCQPVLLG